MGYDHRLHQRLSKIDAGTVVLQIDRATKALEEKRGLFMNAPVHDVGACETAVEGLFEEVALLMGSVRKLAMNLEMLREVE